MRHQSPAPITAPLNWGKRDPQHEAAVRVQAARIIETVLKAVEGQARIDRQLAVGAACPFTTAADRRIWLDEVARQAGGDL